MKILLFVFLLVGAHALAQVNKNGDFQIWDYNVIDLQIKNRWGLRLTEEQRWGDDASELYYVYGQAQIFYKAKWVEFAPGYRQEYTKSSNTWHVQYMPMLDLTFFTKFCGQWAVTNRSRVFYEMPKNEHAFWDYRNRLMFTAPSFLSNFDLKAFAFDEVIFKEGAGFAQNRLGTGLLAGFSRNIQGRIYYMYRNLKGYDKSWTYQNVLGLQLAIYF